MSDSESARKTRRARTIYRAWNALLLPFVPALGAYTLYRRFGQKKSAASFRGQWGNVPREIVALCDQSSTRSGAEATPRIWIHAVSVGETLASRSVARALKSAIPGCILVLSTTTDAGQEAAQAALRSGEIDATFYFPLDLPIPIRRALNAIRPQVFLSMETELWPNFLYLAKQSGALTFLVNGRVSDNLLRRAPQMRALWPWIIGNLDGFLMRSESDATRMKSLGAPNFKVFATGDVKLDALNATQNIGELRARWRRVLDVEKDAPFLIAGSTHAGEDEPILAAFQTLRETFPDARLLLAPRHLERVGEIAAKIRDANFLVALRSEIEARNEVEMRSELEPRNEIEVRNEDDAPCDDARKAEKTAVLLLDTIGELSQIYAAADAAFVGGSLIQRGGHNVLEPVLCGVAVAFGPHIANFREAGALVESADVGQKLQNAEQLAEVWTCWLHDKTWRADVLDRANETLRLHRGASGRVAKIVADALKNGAVKYSK